MGRPMKETCSHVEQGAFLRSETEPYDPTKCFFCQQETETEPFNVRIDNAGDNIRHAVNNSNNDMLKVRLSTAIANNDGHAIDMKYHKPCWTKHVLNKQSEKKITKQHPPPKQVVALVELFHIVENETSNKEYLAMDKIEEAYFTLLDDDIDNHDLYYQVNG